MKIANVIFDSCSAVIIATILLPKSSVPICIHTGFFFSGKDIYGKHRSGKRTVQGNRQPRNENRSVGEDKQEVKQAEKR